jgi:hypothetical protein
MQTHPSRLGRLVALAGAGSALLTVAGYLVIGSNPDTDASVSTVTAYYAAHHATAFAGGILLTYAAVLFALFGLAVWARIRATPLHPVVAGAALVGVAIATVGDLTYAAAWSMLGNVGTMHTISPGAIQSLQLVVSDGSLADGAGIGILLLAFATAGIQTHAFPRVLSWLALVLGILQLVPTPGLFGFFAGLVVLPWMLAAGIAMFVRAGDTAPASAPWVGVGSQTAPDVAR